jgi:hypothetical protein
MPDLDNFTCSYITTMLCEPLDQNYSVDDIAPETLARIIADCEIFQAACAEWIGNRSTRAGHDFWLTRNGHGAGFWDGDWSEPAATELTRASARAGHVDAYIGDNGQIYLSPDPVDARGHAQRLNPDAFTGGSSTPR